MQRLVHPLTPLVVLFLCYVLTLAACVHEPVLPEPKDTIPQDTVPVDTVPVDTVPVDTVAVLPCSPDSVYFEAEILPILVSNCAMSGCHSETNPADGIILTSYQNVITTGDVKPFNAAQSDLYEVLIDTDPKDRMPLNADPLTSAQIKLIEKWINQGGKNLRCDASGCDSTAVTYAASIKPILNTHCVGCHSGSRPGGGILLQTHAQVQVVAQTGLLFGVINFEPGYKPMPQGGDKLPACDILKIKAWVNAGAPNN
ncbi:MAG: hypothetical protein SF053_01500 [Bacteroidia bacterium]|nr:hypothetical protein [Bacteroidia bacterium]